MNKEIYDKIETIKGTIRIVIPNVCKKRFSESTKVLLIEHMNELNEMIKNEYCE